MDPDYGKAAFVPRGGRSLTGDSVALTPSGREMVLDFEVPFPQTFLLVVQIRDRGSPSSGTVASFTVATGMHRGALDEERFTGPGFQRTVIARSVQVVVTNGDAAGSYIPAGTLDVKAVAVPMQLVGDPRLFGAGKTANDVPSIDVVTDPVFGVPRAKVESIASSVTAVSFGLAHKGMAIYNDSPFNLFIGLGSVSFATFTCRLVPGAYYETPFGWSGEVLGLWDGVGGLANVTRIYS